VQQLTVRGLALLVLVLSGCQKPAEGGAPPERASEPRRIPTPAPNDQGSNCLDVFELRACFPGELPVLVPRPLPTLASQRGYRCSGSNSKRVCEDRRHGADPLVEAGTLWAQHHPRHPDDGEWECADLDGVVVCHGGGAPAGVPPGTLDPAFVCGNRRGKKDDRVCVDFSPDRPPEPAKCHFESHVGLPARSCSRGGRGALTRACGAGCPFGSACVSDHCLPLAPKPDCWLDQDCDEGERCGFGTCRKTGT
jgi:hypothetical protein